MTGWTDEARAAARAKKVGMTGNKGYGLKSAWKAHFAAKTSASGAKATAAYARADAQRHPNNPNRGFAGLMKK